MRYKVVSITEKMVMLKRQGIHIQIIPFNNLLEEDTASTVGSPQSVNKESLSNNVCLELLCFNQKVT